MVKQLNIKLSDKALEDLNKMKADLNLPSIAEVIRSSVSLARFLELERQSGSEIIIREKNTNKEKVLVIRP